MTYSPSHEFLTRTCQDLASSHGLELKGVCHSHPGLASPSQPDLDYAARFLDANPTMSKFYMPILPDVPLKPGALPTSSSGALLDLGNMRFWVVHRADVGQYREAEILDSRLPPRLEGWEHGAHMDNRGAPVEATMEAAIDEQRLCKLLGTSDVDLSIVIADGHKVRCLHIRDGAADCLVLLPTEFPLLPPSVVVTDVGGRSKEISFSWRLDSPLWPEERLARLVRWALLAPDGMF